VELIKPCALDHILKSRFLLFPGHWYRHRHPFAADGNRLNFILFHAPGKTGCGKWRTKRAEYPPAVSRQKAEREPGKNSPRRKKRFRSELLLASPIASKKLAGWSLNQSKVKRCIGPKACAKPSQAARTPSLAHVGAKFGLNSRGISPIFRGPGKIVRQNRSTFENAQLFLCAIRVP